MVGLIDRNNRVLVVYLSILDFLPDFSWNVEEDFKTVPESWIPALRVKHSNGHPIPDEHGHIPGSDAFYRKGKKTSRFNLRVFSHILRNDLIFIWFCSLSSREQKVKINSKLPFFSQL